MRQVKGPPAPAPGKHSPYICRLCKGRHQCGPTFPLMTWSRAMVWALQLQEAGGAGSLRPGGLRAKFGTMPPPGGFSGASQQETPPPACAGLWVRKEPYRGAGDGHRHSGAFNPNGQYRKRAAWGREREGISANGQGWSLRSTRGCRLPSWSDVDEPGMKGWKWEPLGGRVSGVTVRRCLEESVKVRRQRRWAWRLGPGRQDTSPGSGPWVGGECGGTRGQQLA